MKRVNNLYEKIISLENLELADKKAQRGKSKQFGVVKHNKTKEQNILSLHKSLVDRTYKTSGYSVFTIYEPKERTISRLDYFPNRIMHHAIMIHLESILTSCFIAQTYSCIKQRGIHKCLKDLQRALKDEPNTEFCLKLDIMKFYPSVDKSILKSQLRTKIKDNDLLNLLDEIIDSNEQGIPIGNLLSQWFANFYLNKFDHWLKENKRIKYYFRYCDDLVILGSNKDELHLLRDEIDTYLHDNLKLKLSNYQVFPVKIRGIDFVGYKTFHTHTLLRKSIKNRFKRMVRRNRNDLSMASYWGWISHGNCRNLWNKYVIDK